MKKGITVFSIFISLFVFGLFAVPQHSEASFLDNFSISLDFGIGNGGYDDYGYDNYGYDNSYYGGYDDYGYDNYDYGYDDYGYYPSASSYGYNDYISPTRGMYNGYDRGYGSGYEPYGYGNYGNSYGYSHPVCMSGRC